MELGSSSVTRIEGTKSLLISGRRAHGNQSWLIEDEKFTLAITVAGRGRARDTKFKVKSICELTC